MEINRYLRKYILILNRHIFIKFYKILLIKDILQIANPGKFLKSIIENVIAISKTRSISLRYSARRFFPRIVEYGGFNPWISLRRFLFYVNPDTGNTQLAHKTHDVIFISRNYNHWLSLFLDYIPLQ